MKSVMMNSTTRLALTSAMRTGVILVAVSMLGGCLADNAGALGGRRELLVMHDRAAIAGVDDSVASVPADGVSVTGLSRDNWAMMDVVVPVDRIRRMPTYTSVPPHEVTSTRAAYAFPTAGSAIENPDALTWTSVDEALMSPVYAVWDMVRMPYAMYNRSPGRIDPRGASQGYWRAPVTDPSRASDASKKPGTASTPMEGL
ncbi:MAG: hypothetical protein AB7Q00_10095 [Phycisphaerales bacterium]